MKALPREIGEAEALLVSALPIIDEVVRFVCQRSRGGMDEIEEFASVVRLKLVERDYAVLRRFEGRSSLRTFLSITIQRLYLDFQRHRWGVWRPSAEARRLGETATQLDVLLHRDGLPLEQAIETLRTNRGVVEGPDELRGLAARLPRRRSRQQTERDSTAPPVVSAQDLVEAPALANERRKRVEALREALQRALRRLPPEDALTLRLRFGDGFTVASIATLLGVPSKPLYHRIERLLAGLRETLRREGFGGAEVEGLFGDPAFDEGREALVVEAGLDAEACGDGVRAQPPGSHRP